MHPITSWHDIALRLALAVVAGFLIGLDRSEHDRPAGMRTTLLVCLAACVSMIHANILLTTTGKAPDSFVSMDVMRLPLGILTGVGFIGAGAIFQRNDLVLGVTTAATIWFVTVIGLCFGGGQFWLGGTATLLALFTLSVLRRVEMKLKQEQSATLTIRTTTAGPDGHDICERLHGNGFRVIKMRESHVAGNDGEPGSRTIQFHLRWKGYREQPLTPPAVHEIASLPGVRQLRWWP